MILADKIIDERKKNGWTQEDLAEKLDVSRQSVSKWESGQSIPDLNRILQMADIFGVSTDYLLKEDIEPNISLTKENTDDTSKIGYTKVSMEESIDFLKLKERQSSSVALGVALCILSPVVLLLMASMVEEKMFGVTEEIGNVIGIVVLFIFVAGGIVLFMKNSVEEKNFKYLEDERIETAYGVRGMVKERKKEFTPKYTASTTIGIVACVLSILPLMVVSLLYDKDSILFFFAAITLIIVSFGVYMLVRAGIIKSSFDILLQEEDYSAEQGEFRKNISTISKIYWSVFAAIYLGYSFLTSDWSKSWLVWVVAGVLWGAVVGVMRLKDKK